MVVNIPRKDEGTESLLADRQQLIMGDSGVERARGRAEWFQAQNDKATAKRNSTMALLLC